MPLLSVAYGLLLSKRWAFVLFCILCGLWLSPQVGYEMGLEPMVVGEAYVVPSDWRGFPVCLEKVHSYGNGQCMPYARERSGLAISGSACDILKRTELATGTVPVVGAVVVTNEGPCGHVAVVEAVKGGIILVSEQNYRGAYIVSRREIDIHSGVIKGYIY
jgi:surface antigen